jgi:hypothetical protein
MRRRSRSTFWSKNSEHVTEYNNPIALIDSVIKPYAEVWDFVRDADFEATEHAETINEHLFWLNRVDFKDWVPPALVYFKRFRQKPKLLAEFFQSLERLTYFMLVTKVGINERIETYAALIKDIESTAFDGDLVTLGTLALTDKQKRDFVAALDGDIYRNLPKARMALVLRLESLVRALECSCKTPCRWSMCCRKTRLTVRTGSSGSRMKTSEIAGRTVWPI